MASRGAGLLAAVGALVVALFFVPILTGVLAALTAGFIGGFGGLIFQLGAGLIKATPLIALVAAGYVYLGVVG